MKTLKIKLEIKPSEKELLFELYKISLEKYSITGEPRDKTNSKVYKAIHKALKE